MQRACADSNYSQYDPTLFLEPPAARYLHRHNPSKNKLSQLKTPCTSASVTKPTGPLSKESEISSVSRSEKSIIVPTVARHSHKDIPQEDKLCTSCSDTKPTGQILKQSESSSIFQSKKCATLPPAARHLHQDILCKNELLQTKPLHTNIKANAPLSKQSKRVSVSHSNKITCATKNSNNKQSCPYCDKMYVFRSSLSKHIKKDHGGNGDHNHHLLCNQCPCR